MVRPPARPKSYITAPWNTIELRLEATATTTSWTSSFTYGDVAAAINNQLGISLATLEVRIQRVSVWFDILRQTSAGSSASLMSTVSRTCTLTPSRLLVPVTTTAALYQSITRSPTWSQPATVGWIWPKQDQNFINSVTPPNSYLVFQLSGDNGGSNTEVPTDILAVLRVLWRSPTSAPAETTSVSLTTPAVFSHNRTLSPLALQPGGSVAPSQQLMDLPLVSSPAPLGREREDLVGGCGKRTQRSPQVC